MSTPCEECQEGPRIRRQRYCKACKKLLIDRLEAEGHLDRRQGPRALRSPEKRQAYEGDPDPSQENAVRHLEG